MKRFTKQLWGRPKVREALKDEKERNGVTFPIVLPEGWAPIVVVAFFLDDLSGDEQQR